MYKNTNGSIRKGALITLIIGIISIVGGGLLLSLRQVFSSTNFDCVPISIVMIALGIIGMIMGFVIYLAYRVED